MTDTFAYIRLPDHYDGDAIMIFKKAISYKQIFCYICIFKSNKQCPEYRKKKKNCSKATIQPIKARLKKIHEYLPYDS